MHVGWNDNRTGAQKKICLISSLIVLASIVGCAGNDRQTAVRGAAPGAARAAAGGSGFEAQVEDYIRRFPYQETFEHVTKYTNGDPAKLNTWVIGDKPSLVYDTKRGGFLHPNKDHRYHSITDWMSSRTASLSASL